MSKKKMSKNFEKKIIMNRVVDTKNYRYAVRECADHMEIVRIALNDLDTTAEWEVVKTIG